MEFKFIQSNFYKRDSYLVYFLHTSQRSRDFTLHDFIHFLCCFLYGFLPMQRISKMEKQSGHLRLDETLYILSPSQLIVNGDETLFIHDQPIVCSTVQLKHNNNDEC